MRLRLIFSLMALSAGAAGEIYDTPRPETELTTREDQFYNDVVAGQANAPILPGETQADYILRTSQVPAGYVPSLPTDNAMVGREGKLDDAARMALHGEQAATASFGRIAGEVISLALSSLSCPGGCAGVQQDIVQLEEAMDNYGQILTAMDYAEQNNSNGKARLLTPEGGSAGGQGSNVTQSSAAGPKPDTVSIAVENLGPKTRQTLAEQGLDPNEVVERLLSGELDLANPGSVQQVLGVDASIPASVIAQARAAPQSARVQQILNGDGNGASGSGVGIRKGAASHGAFAGGGRKKKKNDPYYKDPKLAALAGIPLEMFPGGKPPSNDPRALERFLATLNDKKGRGIRKLTPKQYYQLLSMGVLVPLHRQNIFQIARRHYRNFRNYREGADTMASVSKP